MEDPETFIPEKGIYTFFFSDIEGSTNLLSNLKEQYGKLLAEEQELLNTIISRNGGKTIDITGDGLFAIFSSFSNSAIAAVQIQKEVDRKVWTGGAKVKIRIGIHTGEARIDSTGPVGIDVHKASRIMSIGHGGQILLSESSKSLLAKHPIDGCSIKYLGEYILKDIPDAEKIYQLDISGLANEFPELKTGRAHRSNLPQEVTELIGRDDDIRRLISLVEDVSVRLITVTGPGGIGKTSLSVSVCRNLEKSFTDGVYSVMLSSVSDAALIPFLIASAIGITVKEDLSSQMLKEYLDAKNILLFLDNLEQIPGVAMTVSDLISSVPSLKIIATSRTPLKLRIEKEYPLLPLTFPDEKDTEGISHSGNYSAISMFEKCASKYSSGFRINDENIQTVTAICSRLDGLPLAIELACARLKIFSPEELLERLSSKLDILKSTDADRPERHQALYNTIEWSFDLLGEKEKELFSSLSVFRGGFTIESAQTIAGHLFSDEIEFIDCLEALTEKNLVSSYAEKSSLRFRMLETIREFAWEHLLSSELFRKSVDNHTEYFLKFAEEANRHLDGIEIGKWINIMESELDNIRSAMNRSVNEMNAEYSLRFATATLKYSLIRGNLGKTYSIMKEILSIPYDDSLKNLRAKTLNGIGTLVHELSNFAVAIPLIEESNRIYKETNDVDGIIASTINLSWVRIHIGDLKEAERMVDELFSSYGDKVDARSRSLILNGFGWLKFMRGDFINALRDYDESIELKIKAGDLRGIAFVKINKARGLTLLKNYPMALTLFGEAIETLRKLGDNQLTAWGLSNLSFLELQRCNYESSQIYLEESRVLMKKVFNNWILAYNSAIEGLINIGLEKHENSSFLLKSAVSQFKDLGSKWGIAKALYFNSIYDRKYGQPENLKHSMLDSLALTQCFDDRYTQIQLIENLCVTEKFEDEYNSDRLMRFCLAERRRIGAPWNEFELAVNPGLTEFQQDENTEIINSEEALKLFKECCESL